MKAMHTPGPWKVNRKYKMSVETCADGQGVNLIAECSDPDGFRSAGEDQANAILIAAAPELLAALENAANVLAGIATGDLKTIGKDSPALVQARSAIAKAKGGA